MHNFHVLNVIVTLNIFSFFYLHLMSGLVAVHTLNNRWWHFSKIQGLEHMVDLTRCWRAHQRSGPCSAQFQSQDKAAGPLGPHPVTPRPPDADTLLTPVLPSPPPGLWVSASNWRWETTDWAREREDSLCDRLKRINRSFTSAGGVHRPAGCCCKPLTVIWCTVWDEL